MKTLFLIRHAKSSWENSDLDDINRPLNERGEKDAPRMGGLLKKRQVTPDLIYSSPAVRALTTAKIIADALGYPIGNIQIDRKLYHADEEKLLSRLRETSDGHHCVFLFGHNPALTSFVNELFNESIENIPTAGVVSGELNIASWKAAKWRCGKLLSFDFPKKPEAD